MPDFHYAGLNSPLGSLRPDGSHGLFASQKASISVRNTRFARKRTRDKSGLAQKKTSNEVFFCARLSVIARSEATWQSQNC